MYELCTLTVSIGSKEEKILIYPGVWSAREMRMVLGYSKSCNPLLEAHGRHQGIQGLFLVSLLGT